MHPSGATQAVLATARRRPSAVAVEADGHEVTYGDLVARADRLAAKLPSGALIAVVAPRGAATVVGALAAWRAGSAYLPVDPAYPGERIAWMLQDSGAAVVCTTAEVHGPLGAVLPAAPAAVIDPLGDLVSAGGRIPAPGAGLPEGTAYVVYTSGSTGRPKGVAVGAAGLEQLVTWHNRTFGLSATDRTTLLASPGFDASVWEIWPALAAGASLVVVPEEVRADARALRGWLIDAGITVSFVPTVVAEGLAALPWPASTALRTVLTGGDRLGAAPPASLPWQLVNNYGVSEATVVTTSTVVEPGTLVPSIGTPIEGTVVEVVDDDLQPVPDGTPGELLVGGVAVALGYLGQPAQTAERFVTGPDGAPRYRTGDLVRRRHDSSLEYLGRLDDQLSIRGFRIEPGEVVAALERLPRVAAAVVAGDGQGSARRLVAWVVPASGEALEVDDVRQAIERQLPASMVPSLIVPLEALPTTTHGKVDRDVLLASLSGPARGARVPGDGPLADPTAAVIASVVADLLGLDSVGADEDFFLLGGHSMLGAELLGRLEDLFGVEMSLRALFDAPTVAEIAASVNAACSAPA